MDDTDHLYSTEYNDLSPNQDQTHIQWRLTYKDRLIATGCRATSISALSAALMEQQRHQRENKYSA